MAKILTLTLNPALDLTVQLARLDTGQVNRSDAMYTHAAGKGVNVAQVLADLGHQLTVSGFLGENNPQAFDALFAQRGFVDAFIRVPGDTRSNIKLAESDGRITDINGPGPEVSEAAQQALLERLEQIAPGHDAVVVAGSLPRGVSPEWFQALLLRLKTSVLKSPSTPAAPPCAPAWRQAPGWSSPTPKSWRTPWAARWFQWPGRPRLRASCTPRASSMW